MFVSIPEHAVIKNPVPVFAEIVTNSIKPSQGRRDKGLRGMLHFRLVLIKQIKR
jgi:hypothetical protein